MLLSVLSLLLWFGQPQAPKPSGEQEFSHPEKTRIEFHIVFGKYRPEIDDCKGFGVCDFRLVVVGGISADEQNAMATGEVDGKGKLVLSFARRSGLSDSAYRKYFARGIFWVEADYPISESICRKLGLRTGYVIKSGKYPVKEEGNLVKLTL